MFKIEWVWSKIFFVGDRPKVPYQIMFTQKYRWGPKVSTHTLGLIPPQCFIFEGYSFADGAVYISAKSKFVSTPQIARIVVTSFKLHESR